MKIDTSSIKLSSAHELYKDTQVHIEEETRFVDLLGQNQGQLDTSETGAEDVSSAQKTALPGGNINPWYDMSQVQGQGAVELSAQFLIELKKLREIMEEICKRLNGICINGGAAIISSFDQININSGSGSVGTVLEYEYRKTSFYSYYENESTSFFADGLVKSEDGRSIDFSFELNMDREYLNQQKFVEQEKGYVLIDPLVIEYDRSLPQLSSTSISFDLDQDGEEEEIRLPDIGSGFLSFDKNQDGIINDGSELFGPSTGKGFQELSEYDLDHNNWIDENDDIFNDLTIWENDEDGLMKLTRLKDADIGAIYLVSAATPHEIRDKNNQLQAKVKRSGIALSEESGAPIPIHEMDWTV